MADEDKLLKPNVLWAQTREMVMLRVQVQPAEKPDFKIYDTHINFKVFGTGGSTSKRHYGFELVFHDAVSTEKCRFKMTEKEVEFRLLKQNSGEWPKLQSTHTKPHWIKLDFDHFQISEDEEENDEESEDAKHLKELERMEANVRKELDKIADVAAKCKALYLVLYNTGQWLGFLLISTRLLFLLAFYGQEGVARAYDDVVNIFMVCQLLAILEIVHNLLGFVKGSAMTSFLQVLGRSFTLFGVLPFTPFVHSNPVVFCLFLAWSLIELVRYPFYALSVLNMDIWWITWLRYTLWIPLYPMGFICEYIISVMSILYGPPGGGWGNKLPNSLNFSFNANVLKIFLLTFGPFLFYSMLMYMKSQRKKKLKTKKT